MATSYERFKLSELRLDQENYRTGPVLTQRDAIAAIIDDQKNKLVNLAEDILSMGGISPGEPVWVTRDNKAQGFYVVLEGNRRIATLKLLETPALADGTLIEKEIRTLSKQYEQSPIREIEALVFSTREEALPWQRRRHMTSVSGVGLQSWKPLAKARANRDLGQKALKALSVFELLQNDSDDWAEITDVLDSKWTTVDRVLNSPALSSILGVFIDNKGTIIFENGNTKAGKRLLTQILRAIAAPEFRFSEIEYDKDRESFVSRFSASSVKSDTNSPEPDGGVAPSGLDGEGPIAPAPEPKPPKPPKPALTPKPRTTLAPKKGDKTFQVNGDRLNLIYKECRNITVIGNENAAALLLRVFIELSSEALLVEKNIQIPLSVSKSGKTSWDDIGIPLTTKVNSVLEILDPTGRSKAFQQVRVARDSGSQATFSINTLHGYFHNRHMKPEASAIIEAWNAWEIYLQSLHRER